MANPIQTKTKNKSIIKFIPEVERLAAIKKYESSGLWDKKNKRDQEFESKFFTLQEVRTLRDLLGIIYPTSKYVPSQLNQANDDLIDIGTIVKYFPRNLPESKKEFLLAFVQRVSKNIFRIFINEDCEDESFDSMDLHEKGHILFNHTQSVKFYIDEFKEELEKVWDTRLAKYFEDEVRKNPKNKDKIVKLLFREFSNIAQDMEINSKLFENDEWIKAKKTMGRSGMIVHLKYLESQIDDMSGLFKNPQIDDPRRPEYKKLLRQFEIIRENIKLRLSGEEGDFQFCYPGNKGWPLKLDWMTYMILLVKDLDETMKHIIQQIKANMGMGQGQGQGGSGNGPTTTGSGTGNQPISQDVLDNYDQEAMDKENASGDGGDNDGEGWSDGDIYDSPPRGRSSGGKGRGRGHGASQIEFESVSTFEDFSKFLRRVCLGKKNRKLNSDVLYNSNRGKFASRVVVPRRHFIDKWMPQNATFVIDISGSVNSDLVENAVNSIVDSASGIDLKNSHIIFCDSAVSSDEVMSKRTKKVYSGGGTDIAEGIKYVVEKGYCKKPTDFLFVISDLQDNLNNWLKEAKDFRCQCFVVGYGFKNKAHDAQAFRYGGNDSDFAARWNKRFKTIFINSHKEED